MTRKFDIVVCGGGTSGVIAALAAAREQGYTVALVEKMGFLGGTSTMGGPIMGFYGPEKTQIVAGIAEEIIASLKNTGDSPGHVVYPRWNSFTPFDVESYKRLLLDRIVKSSIDLFLHSLLYRVETEANRITAIWITNGEESIRIEGKIFIDATGDAILSAKAGLDFLVSENSQAASQMVRLGGFNKQRFLEFVHGHPEEARGFNEGWSAELIENSENFAFAGFFSLIKEGNRDYDLGLHRDFFCFNTSRPEHSIVMVASKSDCPNPLSIMDITRSEIESRAQDARLIALLREKIPGFEHIFILSTAHQIGIRDTRRIVGAYTLTDQDALQSTFFNDTVALSGYPMDIHARGASKNQFSLLKRSFYIPYRTLYSPKIDNLLVTGRILSCEDAVFGSARVQSVCMATGEAVGIAATISIQNDLSVAEVPTTVLRGKLRDHGAIVDQI